MKKIITKIIAFAAAGVFALVPLSACDGGGGNTSDSTSTSSTCEHSVSTWTVVREPTCTNTGLKRGVCGICLETVEEEIPIDEDAHVYGEWQVTVPTAKRVGYAYKECTENSEHYISVTLPPLTAVTRADFETDAQYNANIDIYDNYVLYTSEVTLTSGVDTVGYSTYTYPHELGDITFTIEIGETGVQTVSDAVSIGTSSNSRSLVRSGTGSRGDKRIDQGAITSTVLSELESSAKDFSYEYYDGYTHILSDGGSQYWMGLDDGEIYGYVQDANDNFNQVTDENYYYGFRYYETYTDTLSSYYGTENFVKGLYTYAKSTNPNNDFAEEVITDDNGNVSYYFSFGTYTIYGSATGGGLFSKIEVTFTLNDSYMIDSFEYYSVTYANDSDTYDSDTGTWGSGATFDFDEDGNAYVKDGNGLKYIETYTVTQTQKSAGDVEEEMKYPANTRFYTDFDIEYNGTKITQNTGTIDLVAGSAITAFTVTNLTPSDAIGDDLTYYYKLSGSDTYTEVNYGTEATEGIYVYETTATNSLGETYYKLQIKSNKSGVITFAVKSRNVTKEFTVNFQTVAPTAFYSTYYQYSTSSGYTPYNSSGASATTSVYAGQPLYFKASLSASEQGKCSETYNVTVTDSTGAAVDEDNYKLAESVSIEDSINGTVSVASFTAYTAGTYTLKLTSTEDENVTCTISVTVGDMPDISSLLKGKKYTGTFSGTKNTVTVGFQDFVPSELIYEDYETDEDSGETVLVGTVYKYTVNARITYSGESHFIVCTFYMYQPESGDDAYLCDSNYVRIVGAVNILESEMSEDEEDLLDEFNFWIEFNEQFVLTISHSAGESLGNVTESALLTT